ENELLVYGGTVVVKVPITAGITSQPGPHTLKGRVRFQACNDQVCLAPVIVPFDLVVTVKPVASAPRNPVPEGGASGPAVEPAGGREGSGAAHPSGPDSAPPQGSGFSTAPPPPGAAAAVAPDNPIARALEPGSAAPRQPAWRARSGRDSWWACSPRPAWGRRSWPCSRWSGPRATRGLASSRSSCSRSASGLPTSCSGRSRTCSRPCRDRANG